MKRLIIAFAFACTFGLGIATAEEAKPSPVFYPEVEETVCTGTKDVTDRLDDKVIEQACVICCADRWTCCCCYKGCQQL